MQLLRKLVERYEQKGAEDYDEGKDDTMENFKRKREQLDRVRSRLDDESSAAFILTAMRGIPPHEMRRVAL